MTYVPPVQPPFVIDAVPFVMVACPIVVVLFRSGPAEKRTRPVGAVPSDAVTVALSVTGFPTVTDGAETPTDVVVDAVVRLVAAAPAGPPKSTARPASTLAVETSARLPQAALNDVAAKDIK